MKNNEVSKLCDEADYLIDMALDRKYDEEENEKAGKDE